MDSAKYIGMDVHTESISIAVMNSEAGIAERWVGAVPVAGVGLIAAAASAPAMTVTLLVLSQPEMRMRFPSRGELVSTRC